MSRIVMRGKSKRVKPRAEKKSAVVRAEGQLAQFIAANHRESMRILRDLRRDVAQVIGEIRAARARKAKR